MDKFYFITIIWIILFLAIWIFIRKRRPELIGLDKDRNKQKYDRNLEQLRKAAEGDENLMPYILDCVHSYATLGETCQVLRDVFGEYEEPAIY